MLPVSNEVIKSDPNNFLAIGGLQNAAAELGRNPVSKRQIQPEYGDEQADAGRDCQTRPARPNS